MTNPDKFTDELISAYLDGELSAEERAEVENTLIESEECRKLFGQLKSIQADLKSLPNHRLDDDFYQRVLRQAERQSLADTDNVQDSPGAGGSAIRPVATDNHVTRPRFGGWFWTAAALAASLLLVVTLNPPWSKNSDLASVTSSPEAERAGEANSESSSAASRFTRSNDEPIDTITDDASALADKAHVDVDSDPATRNARRARASELAGAGHSLFAKPKATAPVDDSPALLRDGLEDAIFVAGQNGNQNLVLTVNIDADDSLTEKVHVAFLDNGFHNFVPPEGIAASPAAIETLPQRKGISPLYVVRGFESTDRLNAAGFGSAVAESGDREDNVLAEQKRAKIVSNRQVIVVEGSPRQISAAVVLLQENFGNWETIEIASSEFANDVVDESLASFDTGGRGTAEAVATRGRQTIGRAKNEKQNEESVSQEPLVESDNVADLALGRLRDQTAIQAQQSKLVRLSNRYYSAPPKSRGLYSNSISIDNRLETKNLAQVQGLQRFNEKVVANQRQKERSLPRKALLSKSPSSGVAKFANQSKGELPKRKSGNDWARVVIILNTREPMLEESSAKEPAAKQ